MCGERLYSQPGHLWPGSKNTKINSRCKKEVSYIPTINDGVDNVVFIDQPGHLWLGSKNTEARRFIIKKAIRKYRTA
jgi:hypothetical protein